MFYSSILRHWLVATFIALSFCSCIVLKYPLISPEDRAKIGDALYVTEQSGAQLYQILELGDSLYNFMDSRAQSCQNKHASFRYIKESGSTQYFLMQIESFVECPPQLSIVPIRIEGGNKLTFGFFACTDSAVTEALIKNNIRFSCPKVQDQRLITVSEPSTRES
jgi:hypothetical protein